MTDEETPNQSALIEALTLNWAQARHAEKQRVWYTSAYAVVGGSIFVAFLERIQGNPWSSILVFTFLGLLTIAGIIIVLKSAITTYYFQGMAVEIAKELRLDDRIAAYGTDHFPNDADIHHYQFWLGITSWVLLIYVIILSALVGGDCVQCVGNFKPISDNP